MTNEVENSKLIQNIEANIFISANAGSGKTKVLVDRFVSFILNGVDVSKILCITYTVSAANEMKERIFKELCFLLEKVREKDVECIFSNYHLDENLVIMAEKNLTNALVHFENLKVQTFHSFCADCIKQKIDKFKVSEDFKIIDESRQKEYVSYIEAKISHDVAYESSITNITQELMLEYGKGNFQKLVEYLVKNIKSFEFILRNKDSYLEIYKSYINCDAKDVKSLNNKIQSYINNANYKHIKSLDEAIKTMFTTTFTLRKKLPFEDVEFAKGLVVEYCNAFKSSSFYLTNLFLDFAQYACDIYEDQKQKNCELDYDDIIHLLYSKLLKEQDTEVIYDIYSRFDHVLIDEAQDMSIDQWEIVDVIFAEYIKNYHERKKTVFIVGDEKQSIYGFRGASVKSFIDAETKYKSASGSNDVPFFKIDLLKSYRSCKKVLEFVDSFSKTDYVKSISNIGSSVHIPTKQEDGEVKIESANDDVEVFIKDLCDEIVHIKNLGTDYNNIMVLVKNRSGNKGFYKLFIRKCEEINIPVAPDKVIGNDIKRCVADIKALIGMVAGVAQVYDFVCLLKSPIFKVTDEDILKHGMHSGFDFFAMSEKTSSARNTIEDIYKKSSSLQEFLSLFALDENLSLGMRQEYGSVNFENIIDTVINKFGNKTFEQAYFLMLDGNLDSIEDQAKNGVKLMTVHQAKGLQAEVVFVVDLQNSFFQAKQDKDMHYLRWVKPDFRFFTMLSRSYKDAMKLSQNFENINLFTKDIDGLNKSFTESENMRMLYVAFTRAERVLYVHCESLPW